MFTVTQAVTADQLDAVRSLMRAFIAWHRERHFREIALITRYFNPTSFEAELANLPGEYAPPAGRLLVAETNGAVVGCVALRDTGDKTCEMKRMFVYPQFQGKGLGRTLADAIVREARNAGYSKMRLDTGSRQVEAQRLYQSLGFKTVDPYYSLPDDLKSWLVFMEIDLN